METAVGSRGKRVLRCLRWNRSVGVFALEARMKGAGGKLRRRSAPTGAGPACPAPQRGAHESRPCQRGVHAPLPGRGQARLADRWVRPALRARLPTGYPHWPPGPGRAPTSAPIPPQTAGTRKTRLPDDFTLRPQTVPYPCFFGVPSVAKKAFWKVMGLGKRKGAGKVIPRALLV